MELTERARADLEAYLSRVEELARRDPDVDADAVVAGLREHVEAALDPGEPGGPVTAVELGEVLGRLGHPAELIGGHEMPTTRDLEEPWQETLQRGFSAALRLGEHLLVWLALLWPLALIWVAAQRGGFLYAWVEGGTRWSGFREPIYWLRIGRIAAGVLGGWLLLVGVSSSRAGASLRSRLRPLWGVEPGRALLIVGALLVLLWSLPLWSPLLIGFVSLLEGTS